MELNETLLLNKAARQIEKQLLKWKKKSRFAWIKKNTSSFFAESDKKEMERAEIC